MQATHLGIVFRQDGHVDNLSIKTPFKLHRELMDVIATYTWLVHTRCQYVLLILRDLHQSDSTHTSRCD